MYSFHNQAFRLWTPERTAINIFSRLHTSLLIVVIPSSQLYCLYNKDMQLMVCPKVYFSLWKSHSSVCMFLLSFCFINSGPGSVNGSYTFSIFCTIFRDDQQWWHMLPVIGADIFAQLSGWLFRSLCSNLRCDYKRRQLNRLYP